MLGAEEHALDVHGLDAIPFFLGDFMGGPIGAGDAGIVDQHVDGTEMRRCRIDGRLDVSLARHVNVPKTC